MNAWLGQSLLAFILLLAVGCDGIVGSMARRDHCGVCGGDDESCRIIAGIYTRTHHKYGYHQIAKIPKGACHINITEMAQSRNYLVLKYSNGTSILNGDRALGRAGVYRAAGTVFRYNKQSGQDCPGDCVRADGPLTEAVDVQLLSFRRNPGIKYMFTVPKDILERVMKDFRPPKNPNTRHTTTHRRTQHGNSHRNSVSDLQTRDAVASQSNKNKINVREKPEFVSPYNTNSNQALQTQGRYGTQDAINRFRQSYTSGTSQPGLEIDPNTDRTVYSSDPALASDGGQTGSITQPRRRTQTGYQTYNREYPGYRSRTRPGYRVRDRNRVPARRVRNRVPATRDEPKLRISNTIDRINFLWSISGFSECSRTCGGGQQETQIVCMKRNTNVKVTEENCDPADKPAIQSVICNKIPCAPDYLYPTRFPACKAKIGGSDDWSPCSATCGAGSQTRRVECRQRISATVTFPVSADSCNLGARPASSRSCNERPCSDWKLGNWTQCSVQCGVGEQTRTVQCLSADGERTLDVAECQGTKPDGSRSCDLGQCAQGWFHSAWTDQCSSACGAGHHTRTIYCAAEDGTQLDNAKCGEKPRHRKACRKNRPCGGNWFEGSWSQCSGTCGVAMRQRDVVCMKMLGSNLSVVDEENCEGKPRPAVRQDCPGLPSCEPEWYSTRWAECSQTCGTGVKTRELKCLDSDFAPSSHCATTDRPPTRRTCNTQSCDLPQLDEDPGCKDKWTRCKLVVQSRLCGYKYYSDQCCSSCAMHHLKHKQNRGEPQSHT